MNMKKKSVIIILAVIALVLTGCKKSSEVKIVDNETLGKIPSYCIQMVEEDSLLSIEEEKENHKITEKIANDKNAYDKDEIDKIMMQYMSKEKLMRDKYDKLGEDEGKRITGRKVNVSSAMKSITVDESKIEKADLSRVYVAVKVTLNSDLSGEEKYEFIAYDNQGNVIKRNPLIIKWDPQHYPAKKGDKGKCDLYLNTFAKYPAYQNFGKIVLQVRTD